MSQETSSFACFVPLALIMTEHGGDLAMMMEASDLRNCIVTMPVVMDVAEKATQSFFVGVAVTLDFEHPEALLDEFGRSAPSGHIPIFAWVPANSYGSDEFGIFIEADGCGETLANGMVNEVIEQARIEATVAKLAKQIV